MNIISLVIGLAVLMFGLYNAGVRRLNPGKLKKREALQELFGDKTGDLIFLGVYALIPLVAGASLLAAGFKGISLF